MKSAWIGVFALLALMLAVSQASAQQPPRTPRTQAPVGEPSFSPGELTPTPEMWFYLQEKQQYDDPKYAVRRKAEFRAGQRQARLASMQWFGFSNARPVASPTPLTTGYSPQWTSNIYQPFWWGGTSGPSIIIARPERWSSTSARGLW